MKEVQKAPQSLHRQLLETRQLDQLERVEGEFEDAQLRRDAKVAYCRFFDLSLELDECLVARDDEEVEIDELLLESERTSHFASNFRSTSGAMHETTERSHSVALVSSRSKSEKLNRSKLSRHFSSIYPSRTE